MELPSVASEGGNAGTRNNCSVLPTKRIILKIEFKNTLWYLEESWGHTAIM